MLATAKAFGLALLFHNLLFDGAIEYHPLESKRAVDILGKRKGGDIVNYVVRTKTTLNCFRVV